MRKNTFLDKLSHIVDCQLILTKTETILGKMKMIPDEKYAMQFKNKRVTESISRWINISEY